MPPIRRSRRAGRLVWGLTASLVVLSASVTKPAPAGAEDALRAGASPVYANPVHPSDFPDPAILAAEGQTYAYATNTFHPAQGWINVTVMVSDDLAKWTAMPDALPDLPDWSAPGVVWAPSVLTRGERYVLYYTTSERASGLQCISRAVSSSPSGPFTDSSSGPLVCQRERNGSIDPSAFVGSDGTPYLLYKSEGVAGQQPTIVWVSQLSPDGLDLVGEETELLRQDQVWEAPIV